LILGFLVIEEESANKFAATRRVDDEPIAFSGIAVVRSAGRGVGGLRVRLAVRGGRTFAVFADHQRNCAGDSRGGVSEV
jgi:hypothetical protein